MQPRRRPFARTSAGSVRLSVTKTPCRRSRPGPLGHAASSRPRSSRSRKWVVSAARARRTSCRPSSGESAGVSGGASSSPGSATSGRAEARAGGRLAQERHRHVRDRAVVLHPRQVGRGVAGEGDGAGARRDPRQQLQQGGEAVAAADRVPGLAQVVAESPRVDPREERDAPLVHRADLVPRRRRQGPEGLEVEARAVVGEVGGEDEERPAVVELREPLRERALEAVVRVADQHRDEAEAAERRLQERQLDLDRVLALGDARDHPRVSPLQGGERPVAERDVPDRRAVGAWRRRGRSRGRSPGGTGPRRPPARSRPGFRRRKAVAAASPE